MRRIVLFALCVIFVTAASRTIASVPPRPEQPHPDIFQVAGITNLQDYSPLHQKAVTVRAVAYRLITMPGCSTGSIPNDLLLMADDLRAKTGFNLTRNDSVYDFTVRINCGSEQIRICGAVNIFCLGRGFPQDSDVELSDILSTYQPLTRISVPCHEICGHALEVANEQYCVGYETSGPCQGLTQFTPAPNWVDIMNTGPDSRHLLGDIELERWARIMYELAAPEPCSGPTDQFGNVWDSCLAKWRRPDGRLYDPATGQEFLPDGTLEWSACNPDRLRFNAYLPVWMPVGSGFFAPARGFWSFAPPC